MFGVLFRQLRRFLPSPGTGTRGFSSGARGCTFLSGSGMWFRSLCAVALVWSYSRVVVGKATMTVGGGKVSNHTNGLSMHFGWLPFSGSGM